MAYPIFCTLILPPATFDANFPLAGLPEDTLALKIVATDILNNKDSVIIPFIHDLPPVINIDSPINYSTARPTIPIKAKCTDNDGHCNIQVTAYFQNGPSIPIGTFSDSVNTILDFSPYDRSEAYFSFISVDSEKSTNCSIKTVLHRVQSLPARSYKGLGQYPRFQF